MCQEAELSDSRSISKLFYKGVTRQQPGNQSTGPPGKVSAKIKQGSKAAELPHGSTGVKKGIKKVS